MVIQNSRKVANFPLGMCGRGILQQVQSLVLICQRVLGYSLRGHLRMTHDNEQNIFI